MATYTPRVCLTIEVEGASFEIHEGTIIHDLMYTKNNQTVTATGKVRVINTDLTRATVPTSCPPESYFDNIADCPSFVFDTSDQYQAKLDLVPIDAITHITAVSGDSGTPGNYQIPIVDDTDDLDQCSLYQNYTVFDRIEE